VEYSIHEFIGSDKLGTKAITPIKFAEINLSYKGIEGKNLSADFVVIED
jgi:hypothetical protein